MIYLAQLVLAFVIATSIALLELITSKYPRTFFLLKKSWSLYTYATIYGAISVGVLLGLNSLTREEIIKLQGFGLSNPWVQAIIIGLVIKAFLHIRLFSVGVGSQSFPVGIETIVQLFEPWLLRTIELEHFNVVRDFIGSRAGKFSDLNDVNMKIKSNLPRSFSEQERTAFEADVNKATTVVEAMELCLGFLGKKSFERIFPLQ